MHFKFLLEFASPLEVVVVTFNLSPDLYDRPFFLLEISVQLLDCRL
jgi:hypothetical protein